MGHVTLEALLKDQDDELFAQVDGKIFKSASIVDTHAVMRSLGAANNFQSFADIVQSVTSADFPDQKSLFKLKGPVSQGEEEIKVDPLSMNSLSSDAH